MRRITFILFAIIFLFTGCGNVKSADALYQWAQSQYGDCTIVSKSETADQTVVVLHDTLQDFDYEVMSAQNAILIDGSNFGSLPNTTDTFETELRNKIISNVEAELDGVCRETGSSYEITGGDAILAIYAQSSEEAKDVGLKFAEILQAQNLNHRLDGLHIDVERNGSGEHFGSVTFPDIVWKTPEEEEIGYYTEMARLQTDEKAVFLRTEKKTFSDTGADLNRVVCVLGSDYPTDDNSPVTFYYFESGDGTEYYLCDFNYYDEDGAGFQWYTNYRQ